MNSFREKNKNIVLIPKCIYKQFKLGVDRLSAPILSILPIIDIGYFQNIFADIFFLLFFYYYYFFIFL